MMAVTPLSVLEPVPLMEDGERVKVVGVPTMGSLVLCGTVWVLGLVPGTLDSPAGGCDVNVGPGTAVGGVVAIGSSGEKVFVSPIDSERDAEGDAVDVSVIVGSKGMIMMLLVVWGISVFVSPIDSETDDGRAERDVVDVSMIVGSKGVMMPLVVLGIVDDVTSSDISASQVRINEYRWRRLVIPTYRLHEHAGRWVQPSEMLAGYLIE
jgi:hypothetical protein